MDEEDLNTLEKFVVMIYDRSTTVEGVDDTRLDMFIWKQRPYEVIPPVLKHDVYQVGCIWSQPKIRQPERQTPAN